MLLPLFFQCRDKLLAENIQLKNRIDNQSDTISSLKTRIGLIRQQTLTFILDQMDTLNMQRDTEVWLQVAAWGLVSVSGSRLVVHRIWPYTSLYGSCSYNQLPEGQNWRELRGPHHCCHSCIVCGNHHHLNCNKSISCDQQLKKTTWHFWMPDLVAPGTPDTTLLCDKWCVYREHLRCKLVSYLPLMLHGSVSC